VREKQSSIKELGEEKTMTTAVKSITLEEFLELPETEPASEYIDGQISQKPMPQGEHSLIQGELITAINKVAKTPKVALALPELRCTFGGATVVPDVAVFRWERIPREESGRIANRFESHPDWAIEILSPEQSQTKVLRNLLHCSRNGTELGWLILPDEDSILTILPNQRIELLGGTDQLPVLSNINLSLTVEQVFSWLNLV
jgi:Uma2 family endonuclease